MKNEFELELEKMYSQLDKTIESFIESRKKLVEAQDGLNKFLKGFERYSEGGCEVHPILGVFNKKKHIQNN